MISLDMTNEVRTKLIALDMDCGVRTGRAIPTYAQRGEKKTGDP